MTPHSEQILREALDLPPTDRAELVEQILASFEFPARREIDAAWARKAEGRIDADEGGEVGKSSAEEEFREIDQQANR